MRNYAGSALILVVTTAVIVGSYTVNLKVSAERNGLESLRRSLVADARSLRDLQAELRTRARLPQMQRWNDDVLQMSAPAAGQYLRNPMQLVGYAAPTEIAPSVRRAVTAPAPALLPDLAATVVRAAYRAEAPPVDRSARVVAVGYRASAVAAPAPVPELAIVPEPASPSPSASQLPDGGQ